MGRKSQPSLEEFSPTMIRKDLVIAIWVVLCIPYTVWWVQLLYYSIRSHCELHSDTQVTCQSLQQVGILAIKLITAWTTVKLLLRLINDKLSSRQFRADHLLLNGAQSISKEFRIFFSVYCITEFGMMPKLNSNTFTFFKFDYLRKALAIVTYNLWAHCVTAKSLILKWFYQVRNWSWRQFEEEPDSKFELWNIPAIRFFKGFELKLLT